MAAQWKLDRRHAVGESQYKKASQNENERVSVTPFLLPPFSLGDKFENCSAQFLAVCWMVHVDFKVQRLRNRFGVSNALLLHQSLPTFIGHNLDKIGDGTLLYSCHLFQFLSLLFTHRDVELWLLILLFGFRHLHLNSRFRFQADASVAHKRRVSGETLYEN